MGFVFGFIGFEPLLYLHADDNVYQTYDDAAISDWDDKQKPDDYRFRQDTNSSRPHRRFNQINNEHAIEFDGDEEFLTAANVEIWS